MFAKGGVSVAGNYVASGGKLVTRVSFDTSAATVLGVGQDVAGSTFVSAVSTRDGGGSQGQKILVISSPNDDLNTSAVFTVANSGRIGSSPYTWSISQGADKNWYLSTPGGVS